MFRDSSATVICWAMGITQHRNAVATIKEITNVALAQGNIGKPGAGLCPVRGHSNVQGDRTMGIWERVPDHFLDALRDEFGFDPPREHGHDSVNAVRALRDGDAKVFMGMGGNFVSAMSDTDVTEDAMRRADLTVHVSTKLNRSHVVTGREALILPVLGRSEKDRTGGREQRVTVEDSMSAVHASKGPLDPASPHLRSEVDIVCSLALATLGADHPVPWAAAARRLHRDPPPDRPRRTRLRVVRREGRPARRLRAAPPAARLPDLPHRRRARQVHGQPDRRAPRPRGPAAAPDAALARPVQHHDLRARRPLPRRLRRPPRGVRAPRRHHRARAPEGDLVDLVSEWTDGSSGRRRGSGWSPTTSRGAARRRTTPRPTRWSRSTTSPRAATARRRSRSSSGSTRAEQRRHGGPLGSVRSGQGTREGSETGGDKRTPDPTSWR